ncbi:MAG: hypothetical protein HY216_05325 [Candidatus Rokubacteria bacterium]|nr:hypothetical protein [Candidatus Rokubacteria bacterium]
MSGLRWISYPLFALLVIAIIVRRMRAGAVVNATNGERAESLPGARLWLGLALIAAATSFGLYARTIGPWVHDDAGFSSLVHWELRHTVGSLFIPAATYSHHGVFRPLGPVSHVVDDWVWGVWKPGWHITQVFLYGVSVYLVAGVAWMLTRDAAVSLVSAALFGVHPIHFPVVAWVATRADLLATVGYLATLVVFAGYLRSGRRRYLVGAIVALVVAVLTKGELAATLPVAMGLLVMYDQPGLRGLRRAVRIAIPMFAIVVAFYLYQLVMVRTVVLADTGLQPRFVSLALLSHTWWELFYPVQEFVVRSVPLRVALSALLTLPLLALTWVPVNRRVVIIALVLVVSAAPGAFVMEASPRLAQARILYLSSAFLAIVVALGFVAWWRSPDRTRRTAALMALLGTLLGYAALSAINAGPWIASGRLAAELPGALRALSAAPFAGPLQVWGFPRDDVDPAPSGVTHALFENYYGGRLSQRLSSATGRFVPEWVFPAGVRADIRHDGGGAVPDIGRARAADAHVVLWSPTRHEARDVTDALRRRLAVPCDDAGRESRAVLGAAGAEGRWQGRTWGTPHQLRDDGVRWVPERCDRLVFALRLRTVGRPHPYWNHLVVSWRGTSLDDPELMAVTLKPIADGAVHTYDVALGRYPRWLLLEEVTGVAVELPRYPAGVEISEARLIRSPERAP